MRWFCSVCREFVAAVPVAWQSVSMHASLWHSVYVGTLVLRSFTIRPARPRSLESKQQTPSHRSLERAVVALICRSRCFVRRRNCAAPASRQVEHITMLSCLVPAPSTHSFHPIHASNVTLCPFAALEMMFVDVLSHPTPTPVRVAPSSFIYRLSSPPTGPGPDCMNQLQHSRPQRRHYGDDSRQLPHVAAQFTPLSRLVIGISNLYTQF